MPELTIDMRRVRVHDDRPCGSGPIIYWMHRNFRFKDNWALVHARTEAMRRQAPLAVVVCVVPEFLDAAQRQYEFFLKGLEEVSSSLAGDKIPFLLLQGEPPAELHKLCIDLQPCLVVTDFDPLRIKKQWFDAFLKTHPCPVHEVDSRNVVPCWIASDHREFSARTFRPKIHRNLEKFLTPFPSFQPHPFAWKASIAKPDFLTLRRQLRVDTAVEPVNWLKPGETAAWQVFGEFADKRLASYDRRNDPNEEACSNLSPYLHFGMISSQGIVLEMRRRGCTGEQTEAFFEELIVRRELAENFCQYTEGYDQVEGFPDWARRSLTKHREDRRLYLYDVEAFDRSQTHDPLWNAAQGQMVTSGKMHGYMRMYWAKKILEWTENPAEALRIAIRLNDRYSLDGRDPNGYAGIAWSIGGVHDRGWTERPVFGTIRYMNDRGAARKFDVKRYIQTWSPQQTGIIEE